MTAIGWTLIGSAIADTESANARIAEIHASDLRMMSIPCRFERSSAFVSQVAPKICGDDARLGNWPGRSFVTKAALGGRAIQRAATRVKSEQVSHGEMRVEGFRVTMADRQYTSLQWRRQDWAIAGYFRPYGPSAKAFSSSSPAAASLAR